MQVIANEKWLSAVAGGMFYDQPNLPTAIPHPFIHTFPGELPSVNVGHAVSQPYEPSASASGVETQQILRSSVQITVTA